MTRSHGQGRQMEQQSKAGQRLESQTLEPAPSHHHQLPPPFQALSIVASCRVGTQGNLQRMPSAWDRAGFRSSLCPLPHTQPLGG